MPPSFKVCGFELFCVLPAKANTTVLSFGSTLDNAKDFTKNEQDKEALRRDIEAMTTKGETKMLDAAYEAVCMLEAAKRPGKKQHQPCFFTSSRNLCSNGSV